MSRCRVKVKGNRWVLDFLELFSKAYTCQYKFSFCGFEASCLGDGPRDTLIMFLLPISTPSAMPTMRLSQEDSSRLHFCYLSLYQSW